MSQLLDCKYCDGELTSAGYVHNSGCVMLHKPAAPPQPFGITEWLAAPEVVSGLDDPCSECGQRFYHFAGCVIGDSRIVSNEIAAHREIARLTRENEAMRQIISDAYGRLYVAAPEKP